jgi:hypothetical protein
VSLAARVRTQVAKRAPRVEEAAVRANWRLRNRNRQLAHETAGQAELALISALTRDGVATCTFDELFGGGSLFEDAAAEVDQLYAARPTISEAPSGSKETFLTKLASATFPADHPFVRIALHPAALAVANGYLRLHSRLRALELWHTRPTPGAPVQTQLWHRDADDVMNVKLFVYFTNVTRAAGPLTYAPGTHPLGDRRAVPVRDSHHRSTDEHMAAVVPAGEWRILEGGPGTVVFADTCGYHKQLKPESKERVKLVGQYVSGTPYVPQALELEGLDPGTLSEDQRYAVFDRPPR